MKEKERGEGVSAYGSIMYINIYDIWETQKSFHPSKLKNRTKAETSNKFKIHNMNLDHLFYEEEGQ